MPRRQRRCARLQGGLIGEAGPGKPLTGHRATPISGSTAQRFRYSRSPSRWHRPRWRVRDCPVASDPQRRGSSGTWPMTRKPGVRRTNHSTTGATFITAVIRPAARSDMAVPMHPSSRQCRVPAASSRGRQQILRAAGAEDEALDPCDLHIVISRDALGAGRQMAVTDRSTARDPGTSATGVGCPKRRSQHSVPGRTRLARRTETR